VEVVLLAVCLPVLATRANAADGFTTVTLRASLTTSSQLYTNPDSPNPIERAAFTLLENQFGGGLEVKHTFPELNLAFSISADYIQASSSGQTEGRVPYEDGYKVIPVELTAYFIIPISGPSVQVFMGGGAGAYVGERTYSLAGVAAQPVDARTGFGIHVLGGASYRLTEVLSITGEMKFRDLQFDATNAFATEQIVYAGRVIDVSTEPFHSTIQTDGIVFHLGVAFSF
jgi:opacity protein-like surface antigen